MCVLIKGGKDKFKGQKKNLWFATNFTNLSS